MNKKPQLSGRSGLTGSPAAENIISHSYNSISKLKILPTRSFNKSHTLPSPILSNDDFEQIPGTYVKKHFYFKKYGKESFDYDYE